MQIPISIFNNTLLTNYSCYSSTQKLQSLDPVVLCAVQKDANKTIQKPVLTFCYAQMCIGIEQRIKIDQRNCGIYSLCFLIGLSMSLFGLGNMYILVLEFNNNKKTRSVSLA